MNLCTDQLVLALADRGTIASVTYLARDCTISVHCSEAAAVPINYGTAEEMVAAAPDLVLAGRYTTHPAVTIAKQLGMSVLELDVPHSLEDVRGQVRRVADALGVPQRGAELIADFDRQLATAEAPAAGSRPVAAIYRPNGMTVGKDSLIDAVLQAAGFDNLAQRLNLGNYSSLPLEVLIASHPDLLVLNSERAIYPSIAESILRHPAIAAAIGPDRRLVIPQALWTCAGIEVAKAVALLRQKRERLPEPSP